MGEDSEFIKPYRTVYKGRQIREFFRVHVPWDVYDDTDPGYHKDMANYAIGRARETSAIYRLPCEWEFLRWEGEIGIVVRTAPMASSELHKETGEMR